MHHRKAKAEPRKRLAWKTFARDGRESGVSPKAAQEFLSAAAPAKDADFTVPTLHSRTSETSVVNSGLEIAKNHGAAKDIGHLLQGTVDDGLNLQRRELLEGRGAEILDFDAGLPFYRFRIDGTFFCRWRFEPALMIQRFADGDG